MAIVEEKVCSQFEENWGAHQINTRRDCCEPALLRTRNDCCGKPDRSDLSSAYCNHFTKAWWTSYMAYALSRTLSKVPRDFYTKRTNTASTASFDGTLHCGWGRITNCRPN